MLNVSSMGARQKQPRPITRNQSGMASIFVVLILMTVLSLISVGFSMLMNRELREALDRQLSTGAFYASESAINDVRSYLSKGGGTSAGCAVPTSGPQVFVQGGDLTGDNSVKYNCVTINTSPQSLSFKLVNPGDSQVFRVDQAALANIWLDWQNPSAGTFQPLGPSLGSLPPEGSVIGTNKTGILRVAIYPVKPGLGAVDSNAQLSNDSRNYFLYPLTGGAMAIPGSVAYSSNGDFVSGRCKTNPGLTLPYASGTERFCNAVVQGLGASGAAQYYVRVTAMYTGLVGDIYATDPSNIGMPALGNQVKVDVTATAADVSRRVSTTLSSTPLYDTAINSVWSMQSMCKLFRVPVHNLKFYGGDVDGGDGTAFDSDGQCFASTPSNGGGPVNPPPPPPPPTAPTLIFSAAPNPIHGGAEESILSWSSTDAFGCDASDGWSGPQDISGATGTGLITSNTTYTLTCVGPGGSVTKSVTVDVIPPPPPPPPLPKCSANAFHDPITVFHTVHAYATGGCDDGSGVWTFTDSWTDAVCGSGSSGPNPGNSVVEAGRGNWTVTFTVTGTGGVTASDSTSFTIGAGPC
jgi:hypothetical protein